MSNSGGISHSDEFNLFLHLSGRISVLLLETAPNHALKIGLFLDETSQM